MDFVFIENITAAIEMAAVAHQNQIRKASKTPYVTHPYTVGMLLLDAKCSEDTIIAGILHDTIEDTAIDSKEIHERFGENVMRFVEGCSEPSKDLPWEVRKQHTLTYLRQEASIEVCQIVCADKLHNILSIQRDLSDLGEQVWDRFRKGKDKQHWYYHSIVDVLGERLPNFTLYHQLKETVEKTFKQKGI